MKITTNRCWSSTCFPRSFPHAKMEGDSAAEEIQKGKGEGGRSGGRGRVPGRTGRRSRCCGFAEVLGLSRAELSGTSIGFRDFKMTAWSCQTRLTKWDLLTRPGWWDIEWNVSKTAAFRQKGVLRACFVRGVKCGPPQAGSVSEMCQVTVARHRRARFWSMGPPQAGLILECCLLEHATGRMNLNISYPMVLWFYDLP